MKLTNTKINAIVEADPRGGYSAYVPSMPGCITEGESLAELEVNLRDAATGWAKANKNVKIINLDSFVMPFSLAY